MKTLSLHQTEFVGGGFDGQTCANNMINAGSGAALVTGIVLAATGPIGAIAAGIAFIVGGAVEASTSTSCQK